MQVSIEATGKLERRLTVRFPADQVEARVRQKMQELGRTVRLKGFRPGKVPARVIEQRFGQQVRSEALSDAIGSSFQEAVRQQNLRPAVAPSITADAAQGPEIQYTATFEVMPEPGPIDVAPLSITRYASSVEEADVDRMIETLRQQRRTWEPVDRAAAAGDMAVFEFSAVAEGVRFPAEGVERAGTILGSGALFAEFEQALTGMGAGDRKSVEIHFAPGFREAALAGKAAQVEIHMIRVQEARLPELDESFIAGFGIVDGGIDRFRADVRANLEREMRAALSARQKTEVVDKLVAHFADIDVPLGMVRAEMQALLGQAQQQARQAGVAPPQDASLFAADAERRVRAYVLLGEIARQNAISVDTARVNDLLATIASTYEEPEKVIELYVKDADLMAGLRNRVLEDQVVDWVVERARRTDEQLPFIQLMQAPVRAG